MPKSAIRIEITIVLLISFGWSGLYSAITLIGYQLGQGVGNTTVALNQQRSPHPIIEFSLQLLNAVQLFSWAALALYLLWRTGIGPRAIGLVRATIPSNILPGLGLAALIGIPGLGLYVAAHALGVNAEIVPTSGNEPWWRLLVLVIIAIANAVAEEVVVVGYLMTRLRQLGFTPKVTILCSALLRGSYHLYQGLGGGLGNVAMGLIFGTVYHRWQKLWALILAHATIDTVAYVGYALLHSHLGWLGIPG